MAGTIVGDSGWAVIVSTEKAGTPGTNGTPSGDIYYFLTDDIKIKHDGLDRFTPASTFTMRYTTNKRNIELQSSNCYITDEVAGTSTEELNLILDFLYTSSIKTGASKVYAWVYHAADAKYLKLSWDGDTHVEHLLGQFKTISSKLTGDEYVWKINFTFKEATLP